MTGPEYTTCVKPEDYRDYSGWTILGGGMWEVADYMLHRKLVCLGSVRPGTGADPPPQPRLVKSTDVATSCAIGRVISFEPPSSKSFPDSIDNDFSFNILLRPTDAPGGLTDNPFVDSGWYHKTDGERLAAVRQGYQGEFLVEQDTPRPHEAGDGDPRYGGYTGNMFYDAASNASGSATEVLLQWMVWFRDGRLRFFPTSAPGAYSVPALHCECEGTRVRDVFNVVDQLPGGGGEGCRKHWYTRIGCFILNLLFAPMAAAFIAEAWNNARDGDYHDAMEGNGDLAIGDLVVVTGRWVFDAAHKGHNELHAVRTIQKIPEPPDPAVNPSKPAAPPAGSPPAEFERFYKDWCGLTSEVPPDHKPGAKPQGMTPAQTAIYDNQQKPENGYVFHPAIDGCAPNDHPAPIR